MTNPFEKLQNQRMKKSNKEQQNRLDQSENLNKRNDKHLLLFLDYSPMVMEVLEQLRSSLYQGLSIGDEPSEGKWYLYRPISHSNEKEIFLTITLKSDEKLKPKFFQCERNTGKFDFHGGPHYSTISKSLSQSDLIKALIKINSSGSG